MSIKQFNGTYLKNEDRIIFRFNTVDQSEYKLWLTRKITHFILRTTNQFVKTQYEKQPPTLTNVISEIQQQSSTKTANFSNAYEAGNHHPIGLGPILVIEMRCVMMQADNEDIFSLDFVLANGGNINLKCPISIIKAINLILEDLNIQADWGNLNSPV